MCTRREWRDKSRKTNKYCRHLHSTVSPRGSPPPAEAVLAKDVLGTSRGGGDKRRGCVGHNQALHKLCL